MSDLALLRREPETRIEQDEEGMLRTVATPGTIGMKVGYVVGVSTPSSTRTAWRFNSMCAHCAMPVDAPTNAALVITPNRDHRIAHRGECFILSLLACNPAIVTGRSQKSHCTKNTIP